MEEQLDSSALSGCQLKASASRWNDNGYSPVIWHLFFKVSDARNNPDNFYGTKPSQQLRRHQNAVWEESSDLKDLNKQLVKEGFPDH